MSHEEAVAFLRQCENEVQLQLYRDPAQTPITALSPTESHRSFRPKPVLRQEAVDMLCTLAVKKLSPGDSDILNSKSRFLSSSPSPRRKKLTKMSRESELINLNLEKIVNENKCPTLVELCSALHFTKKIDIGIDNGYK